MKHSDFDNHAIPVLPDVDVMALLFPKENKVDRKAARLVREGRGKLMRKARRQAIALKHSWLNTP